MRDGRVSLMFLIAGSNNAIRINGRAKLTADPTLRQRFETHGKLPRTVMVIAVHEVYFQCARAIMRSALWQDRPDISVLPTPGQILSEATSGSFDTRSYDEEWPTRAARTMW